MGFSCSWASQWMDLENVCVPWCMYVPCTLMYLENVCTLMTICWHHTHRCPSHPTQTLLPIVGSPPACMFSSSHLDLDTPHWMAFLYRCSSPCLGSDTPHRPVFLCVTLLIPPQLQHTAPGCHCCLLTWMSSSPFSSSDTLIWSTMATPLAPPN